MKHAVFVRTVWLPLFIIGSLPLLSAANGGDFSTKVTATVKLPESLDSFSGRTLELRLYEYDPLMADGSATLVEKITKKDFSHSKGKSTQLKIVIGAKGKVTSRRNYYLTVYVLNGEKRTHIGEKNGKSGLCKVLTNGHSRKVKLVVRAVR